MPEAPSRLIGDKPISTVNGMKLRERLKKQGGNRFERFKIVFPILLAGWIPSILTRTLETKILRDRQTFVQLIAHLVGDDLGGKSTIIEYYQTLPGVAKTLTDSNAVAAGQEWLNQTYFSHPRIDGMFLADGEGRLIASIPSNPDSFSMVRAPSGALRTARSFAACRSARRFGATARWENGGRSFLASIPVCQTTD